ncbi:MAG: hypothetical protein IJ367_03075 [Clostridia bacterium]|nr:hypothetical protein [Clostridia bacterium]
MHEGGKGITEWVTQDITLKPGKNSVTVPGDAKGFYVEMTDKKNQRRTTEYFEVK